MRVHILRNCLNRRQFYFSSSFEARILFVDVDDRVKMVLAVRTLKQTEQDQVLGAKWTTKFRNVIPQYRADYFPKFDE